MKMTEKLKIDFYKIYNRIRTKIVTIIRNLLKRIFNKKVSPHYRFSHVTTYSCGNAGDTALSTCVRRLFNLKFGGISWSLFPLTGKVTEKTIKDFNGSDAVIIGGHGAFLPDTNANDISGWEFACSIEQYNEIVKPIIVFGVGYNYFKGQKRTQLFEDNINYLVRKSTFFGLRNNGSVRTVQSFIDDDIKDKVVFQPCPTTLARYLYPNLKVKEETHKVVFNVALDRADKRMGPNIKVILDQIAKSMYEISKRGYEIHFITHLNKEIEFLKYIDKYKFKYKFHSASSWDIKQLMDFYNEMDVVIGMRGHALLIPFGVNCHIISLGTQEKTKWFLEDINALDWQIDILECPDKLCQKIVNKFIEIHEVNGDLTSKRLVEEQKKLYKTTYDNMNVIKKSLS